VGGAPARSSVYVTLGNRAVIARDKGIGHELDLTLQHAIKRHSAVAEVYSQFCPGGFLEAYGVCDEMDCLYTQAGVSMTPAYILAGGHSSRFGSDKALADVEACPWSAGSLMPRISTRPWG
jgi:hypothetical protein